MGIARRRRGAAEPRPATPKLDRFGTYNDFVDEHALAILRETGGLAVGYIWFILYRHASAASKGRVQIGGIRTLAANTGLAVVERTGFRTVAEAKAGMTEAEFRGWCHYIPREPSVGDRLDDWFPVLIGHLVNAIPFRPGRFDAGPLVPDRWGDRAADTPAPPRRAVRFRGGDLRGMFLAMAGKE